MIRQAAGADYLAGLEQDVLRAFQDLLAAIRQAEQRALAQSGEFVSQEEDTTEEAGTSRAVREILLPAVETFGRQLRDLLPNTGQDPARQATYAATAFVDERMIGLSWPGRRDWMNRPLELQFFGTRSGGEDVFRQIDALTGTSMTERALAAVYLAILDLGFAGKYDPSQNAQQLASYRRVLFKMIVGQDPDLESAGTRLTDPGVAPQQGGQVRFIPYIRPWLAGMVGLVLVFLLVGHVIWVARTDDLAADVSRVTEEMGY